MSDPRSKATSLSCWLGHYHLVAHRMGITTIKVSIYDVLVFPIPQYFNWNGRGRGDGGRVRATMKAVFALVEHMRELRVIREAPIGA